MWGVLSAILTEAIGVKASEGLMTAVGSLQMVCGAVLATLMALVMVEAHAIIGSCERS